MPEIMYYEIRPAGANNRWRCVLLDGQGKAVLVPGVTHDEQDHMKLYRSSDEARMAALSHAPRSWQVGSVEAAELAQKYLRQSRATALTALERYQRLADKIAQSRLPQDGPQQMASALGVFLLDPKIAEWLSAYDPKALEQADRALRQSLDAYAGVVAAPAGDPPGSCYQEEVEALVQLLKDERANAATLAECKPTSGVIAARARIGRAIEALKTAIEALGGGL